MEWILSIVIAVIASGALTAILTWWLNKRKSAAETLQIEAKTEQIKTNIEESLFTRQQKVIDSQAIRLSDQDKSLASLRAELGALFGEVSLLRIEALKTKRYEQALVYLVKEVRSDYPVAVQIAEKIANGELLLPPPENGT